jgi:hypothetical protein
MERDMIDLGETIRVRGNPRSVQRAHVVVHWYLEMVQHT